MRWGKHGIKMAVMVLNLTFCIRFFLIFLCIVPFISCHRSQNGEIYDIDHILHYKNEGANLRGTEHDTLGLPTGIKSQRMKETDEPSTRLSVQNVQERDRTERRPYSAEVNGLKAGLHIALDEIFIQDTTASVPSQEMVDDFYAEVKRDNDRLKGLKEEMYDTSRKYIPAHVSLMDRLWSAVIDGSLPAYENSLYREENPKSWNYAETVQNFLEDGSAIEIGSGASIHHIAQIFPKMTNVGVITSEKFIGPVTQVAQTEGLSNLYLTRIDPELLVQRMEVLQTEPQVLFGNILITNITSLVGNLLPHEFEEMLGLALSLARRGFIMGSCNMDNAFFEQNWSTFGDLIKRACSVRKMHCSVRNLVHRDRGHMTKSDLNSIWGPSNAIMVKIKSAERPITKNFCKLLGAKEKCYLQFGTEVMEDTILFDDKTKQTSAVNADVVSFKTLMLLGATKSTRGQLMVKALQKQWTSERFLPSQLAVFGDQVTTLDEEYANTDAPKPDVKSLKMASGIPERIGLDTQMNEDTNNNRNESLKEAVPALKISPSVHNELKHKQSKVDLKKYAGAQNRRTEKRDKGPPPTTNPSTVSVAKSQVDGVAQMWNRVDVESPTAVRIDDQQYQAMGRHWDREDRTRGDPLTDQENRQLDRFNQAWEREQPQVIQMKHKTGSPNNDQQGNGDNVLRRDEKELRRAMGFLLGETDMKEVEAVLKHHQLRKARPKLMPRKPFPGRVDRKKFADVGDGELENIILRGKNLRLMPRIGNPDEIRMIKKKNEKKIPRNFHSEYQNEMKILQGLGYKTATKARQRDKIDINSNSLVQSMSEKNTNHVGQTSPVTRIDAPIKKKVVSNLRVSNTSTKDTQTHVKSIEAPFKDAIHWVDKLNDFDGINQDQDEKNDLMKNAVTRSYLGVDKAAVGTKGNKMSGPLGHNHETEGDRNDNAPAPENADDGPDYVGVDHYNPGEGTPQDDYVNEVDHPNIADDDRAFDSHGNVREDIQPGQARQSFGFHGDKTPNDGDSVNGKSKDYLKDDSDVANFQQEEDTVDEQEDLNDQQVYDGMKVSEEDYHTNYGRRLLSKESGKAKPYDSFVESFHGLPDKYKTLIKHALHVKNKEKGEGTKNSQKDLPGDELPRTPASTNEFENTTQELFWIDQEEMMYDQLWSLIKGQIRNSNKHQAFNVFTYGTRSQSLLGIKIARTYPTANVLSIMPHQASSSSDKLRKMIDSVSVSNMVLLTADLNAGLVETLSHSPDLAKYQILGLNVFEMILHLRLGFPFYLGRLLSLASTSFLQVPHPHQLKTLAQYLRPNMDSVEISDLKGLVHEALRLVSAENVTLTWLSQPETNITVLQIHIHTLKRPVQIDCATSMAYLHIRPSGSVYLTNHVTQMEVRLERARKAYSLHFMLEAGLRSENTERARFFTQYLKLSLRQDMCPIHFVWYNYSLLYRPIFSTALPLNLAVKTSRLYSAQTSLKLTERELDTGPFSFLEYGCYNSDLLMALAAAHPDSSLIALVNGDPETANKIHQRAKLKGLVNLITLNTTLNEKLTSKLMRSPEFIRYQYIGLETFLKLMTHLESRYQFDLMLGQTIATGVTTLIQIPSDKIFSLAMTTFFPWAYSGKPPTDGHGPQMYYLNEHPLPIYRNSERKIIVESLKADVKVEVNIKVIAPHRGGTNELLPWKLIRLDVKNLTTEVDHHFEYQLDGHARKYTLRCETYDNETQYKVWLIRQVDGFKIPYGSVHVISLIALLRMGLLEDIKLAFYEKFLNLPLYEDMAPWNIVFDAGNLTYIDFDSRNVTLNRLAPAAFQLIVMMLNYERTIQDFGKCNQPARVMYGINVLGRCVGSQYFGPCSDKMKPVPCGDRTCRSTYMDCLQALQTLEKKKEVHMEEVRLTLKKGETGLIEDATRYDVDTWKFDLNGPKTNDGWQEPNTI